MNDINIFLKLKLHRAGEVKGEVGPGDHKDEILIQSYSWGLSTAVQTTADRGLSSIPTFHAMVFVMQANRATPVLIQAAATDDPVVEAVLACRHANAKTKGDFLKITLTSGLITSYKSRAHHQKMIPRDAFRIAYQKCLIEYRSVLQGGELGPTIQGSFDVANPRQGSTGGRSPSKPLKDLDR